MRRDLLPHPAPGGGSPGGWLLGEAAAERRKRRPGVVLAATGGGRARAGAPVPGRAVGRAGAGRCPPPSCPLVTCSGSAPGSPLSSLVPGARLCAEESSRAQRPGRVTAGAQASRLPVLTHRLGLRSGFRPRTPALQLASVQERPSGAVQSTWKLGAEPRPWGSVPCEYLLCAEGMPLARSSQTRAQC